MSMKKVNIHPAYAVVLQSFERTIAFLAVESTQLAGTWGQNGPSHGLALLRAEVERMYEAFSNEIGKQIVVTDRMPPESVVAGR